MTTGTLGYGSYLKIKCLVAVESQDEFSQLIAQAFDRLGLSCACWSEGRSTQFGVQCLGHSQEASIGQWGLNQFVLDSQVLVAVRKLGIGYSDLELLGDIGHGAVVVESQLSQPVEGVGAFDLVSNELASHVALVNVLDDLWDKFKLV